MSILIRFFLLVGLIKMNSGRLIDLSHGYDNKTLFWPGGEQFHYTAERRGDQGKWYASNDFATAEHSGTHLDAPYHFCESGLTVSQIPLEKLFAKGVIMDISSEVNGRWDYVMPESVLHAWVKKHGPLPSTSVVLISFGWAHKYPNKTEYMGPSNTDLRFPGISVEAAHWLINTKKVVGVGLDTPSIDASTATDAPVHRLLCSNNMYILENVAMANIKHLPVIVDLVVLPMKLEEGTGAPVRIVAKTK